MPVTLLNGFVLLTHPADWSQAPEWQRTWQTGITAALTGAEQRQAMRAAGRQQLSYVITALSLEERAVLDECLDAASVSGLACVPFFGRGSALTADVNAEAVAIADTAWPWAVGDYAFLQSAAPSAASSYLFCEVRRLTGVAGQALTLDQNVARTYPAGSMIWPLLFGKFTMEKEDAQSSWHSSVKVTIAELTPGDQPVIGNAPAPGGPGIGTWAVGSTFVVQ